MGVTTKQRITEITREIIQVKTAPETFLTTLFGKDISTAKEYAFKESKILENFARARDRNAPASNNDIGGDTVVTLSGVHFHEEVNLNNILTDVIGIGDMESMNVPQLDAFAIKVEERVNDVVDSFTRAKIVAAGQLLETGVLTFYNDALTTHKTFNFKRPAGSKVDLGAGAYWGANAGTNIKSQFNAMDDYFRGVGYGSGEYDMICDKTAITSLENTTYWKNEKLAINYPDISRDGAMRKRSDATYYGNVNIAGIWVNIWISNGKCLSARGGNGLENYINPNKVVFIPTGLQLGKFMDFPMDGLISTDRTGYTIGMSVADIHYWNEPDFKQSTLIKHMATVWNIAPYQRKAIYTLQIAA